MYRRKKFITKTKDRVIIGRREKFQLEIYPTVGFTIKYLPVGYNDYGNTLIIFQLFFGAFYLTLPLNPKIKTEFGHDGPSYGITYHNKSFLVYSGRKCKMVEMPYAYTWIRTSLLLNDNTWEHETKGNHKNFYEKEWIDRQWQITIPYKHKTSNEGDIDVDITCHITEREWRQRWLKWTKIGANIKKSLEVEFSDEVGEMRGSYKGGVLGTGFDITKTGKIEDGLKIMEKKYNMYSIAWDRQRKIKQIIKK